MGVRLEATVFTPEISPNGNPKINLLTLLKGFFMKIFNNFGRKLEIKGGVPHISTFSLFNTILKKKKKKKKKNIKILQYPKIV